MLCRLLVYRHYFIIMIASIESMSIRKKGEISFIYILKEIQTHQVRIGWRFSNMWAICLMCCVCAVSLVYCLCAIHTSVWVLKLRRVCLLAVCYPSCVASICHLLVCWLYDVLSVYCLCAIGPYVLCLPSNMLSVFFPFRELSVHTVRPSFLRSPSMCYWCVLRPCVFCALSVNMLYVRWPSICFLYIVHPCVICALSVVSCVVCSWVVCVPCVHDLFVCHAYMQSVCHAHMCCILVM